MEMDKILFDAPIPGQSLTQDPDTPMPYERPPEFTNFEKAQEYLFDMMMDMSGEILELLNQGIPVSFVGPQFAVMGAMKGKWNPDLMLLLLEPAIYITIYIAEMGGVEYVLDFDETTEYMDERTKVKADSHLDKVLSTVIGKAKTELEDGSVLDNMPQSLLAKAEGMEDE
jgi:hypothetical protein